MARANGDAFNDHARLAGEPASKPDAGDVGQPDVVALPGAVGEEVLVRA